MVAPVITHAFISPHPQGPDSSVIYGPQFNAPHVIVGIENVDNTSDANKPISTATQAALGAKVAGPAAVSDDLPAIFDGTTGKLIKSKTYAAFKVLLALVKGDVGLGSVDNTADASKPVSTAQAAAIALKANLAGGNSFTGNQAVSGTLGVSGDLAGAGAVSSVGGFSSPAITQQFGPGGTANGIAAQIILNGSSGNNSGGGMRFQRNGVNLFAFGTYAGILGGGASPAGDDFVMYSYVSGAGATAAINIQSATGAVQVQSNFGTASPSTKTGNYTVGNNDSSLILNGAASITLTLPSAASFPGRWLHLKNIAAFTVVSSAANVVPQGGGAAGTAILAAAAGKWAVLQSDGVSSWQLMMSN